MKIKSKILIGIFLTLLSTPAYTVTDGIIIKAQRNQPDNVCQKVCGKSVLCELVSYSDWSNTIQCPGMEDQWVNNSGELINSEPDEQTPTTKEDPDLFKLDDKKTEKYTVDAFKEKLKDLEDEYLFSVLPYENSDKCTFDKVERLGIEYEKKYKKLADNTEGLSPEDREEKLDDVRKTIKEQNTYCLGLNNDPELQEQLKADINAIVEAYKAQKAELDRAAAEKKQTAQDDGEAQEKQPA